MDQNEIGIPHIYIPILPQVFSLNTKEPFNNEQRYGPYELQHRALQEEELSGCAAMLPENAPERLGGFSLTLQGFSRPFNGIETTMVESIVQEVYNSITANGGNSTLNATCIDVHFRSILNVTLATQDFVPSAGSLFPSSLSLGFEARVACVGCPLLEPLFSVTTVFDDGSAVQSVDTGFASLVAKSCAKTLVDTAQNSTGEPLGGGTTVSIEDQIIDSSIQKVNANGTFSTEQVSVISAGNTMEAPPPTPTPVTPDQQVLTAVPLGTIIVIGALNPQNPPDMIEEPLPTSAPSAATRRFLEEIDELSWDNDSEESPFTDELNDLWIGNGFFSVVPQDKDLKLSLVLTYCDGELGWLRDYTNGFTFHQVFVVAKCGIDPKDGSLPEKTEIIHLPNVGGCDHTMAYWMSEIFPYLSRSDENELVVFLKDNMKVRDESLVIRDFPRALGAASQQGFSCILGPNREYGFSFYHDTDVLEGFEMKDYTRGSSHLQGQHHIDDIPFKSPFETLGEWHTTLGIELPRPLSPVCYGGMYVVQASRIEETSVETFEDMALSLSRGNNIEEGHFAERTWAALFLDALNEEDASLLVDMSRMIYPFHDSWTGSLMKYEVDLEKPEMAMME